MDKTEISQHLIMLAEMLGYNLKLSLQKLYVDTLAAELTDEQLRIAFGRAWKEYKFFPKMAELLELAGQVKQDQSIDVEADAAFKSVIHMLEKYGLIEYPNDNRPRLPERTLYALRSVGGLQIFNDRLEPDAYPFLEKDFAQAYRNFSAYKSLASQIESAIEPKRPLLLPVPSKPPAHAAPEPPPAARIRKRVPQPMTDAEVRDRRQILQQQIGSILERRKGEAK